MHSCIYTYMYIYIYTYYVCIYHTYITFYKIHILCTSEQSVFYIYQKKLTDSLLLLSVDAEDKVLEHHHVWVIHHLICRLLLVDHGVHYSCVVSVYFVVHSD